MQMNKKQNNKKNYSYNHELLEIENTVFLKLILE